MSRPTLRQLLESGEIDRLFGLLGSWVAVAAQLDVNEVTLRRERRRHRERLGYSDGDKNITAGISQNVISRVLPNLGMSVPNLGSDHDPLLRERLAIAAQGRLEQKREEWGEFEDEEKTEPGIPLTAIPQHHAVKGVSTLLAPDGSIKQQWIKTTAQNDDRADWLEAIRDMGGELPRFDPVPAPAHVVDDLLAVFPVGDPHVGLNAWHEDAGENFNMEIAERNLIAAFKHLIDRAPAAAMALLIFIGDNSHVDSQSNTTTAGTRQDADSRTVKIARTIIRICRRSIDLALAKFGRAHMKIERGNHDELISAMVALALSLAYENEPRVEIDVSPEMYHWFRWGYVLIGTHHGDRAKPMDLLGVMAVDRADDWSATKHRRFYCGHIHHQVVKEVPGLIVEYLPTLAGSDAWHRSMGYRSQRAMYMDVFHKEHGHVDRHIIGIDRLRAA